MPALIPADNTLGALFIGTVLSSVVYGVTWLKGYSYCSSHCSQDRWPLKSFPSSSTRLVDTLSLAFCICTTYQFCVTNFGDYQSIVSHPCYFGSLRAAVRFHAEFVKQPLLKGHSFYAYRIYRLGGGSPYFPAAIALSSLVFSLSATALKHIHDPDSGHFDARFAHRLMMWAAVSNCRSYQGLCFAGLSCKVLCDALITTGMVYYLLSNRTQVRRTNNVLNLLAIYSINCGTLHLVFSVVCLTSVQPTFTLCLWSNINSLNEVRQVSRYAHICPVLLLHVSAQFLLNSRRYLRETLHGPEGVVATFTQLTVRTGPTVPWGIEDTTEASTNAAVSLPPASVSSDTSLSDNVIAFDRERYPVPPVMQLGSGFTGNSEPTQSLFDFAHFSKITAGLTQEKSKKKSVGALAFLSLLQSAFQYDKLPRMRLSTKVSWLDALRVSLPTDPVSTPTPPRRTQGRKNPKYPTFAQVLVEKPHERNPPGVPGVVPAYDQALAYIRLDLGLDADIRHALAKHRERGGGIEDARKWLDVPEIINMPEVRWKADIGQNVYRDLVGETNEGVFDLLIFLEAPPKNAVLRARAKRTALVGAWVFVNEQTHHRPQFHPEPDPYHLVNIPDKENLSFSSCEHQDDVMLSMQ
ncbi:hypothetical protein EDB89DRAFT_1908565 [Lactarius sanguifluus]|nr:hypothetical protein EDB89DRAFT_1908565 [Lactarius sanguifluus]